MMPRVYASWGTDLELKWIYKAEKFSMFIKAAGNWLLIM